MRRHHVNLHGSGDARDVVDRYATATLTPQTTTEYEWRFSGTGDYLASTSPRRAVAVAQVVNLRATRTILPRRATVAVCGQVALKESGRYVYLQRHDFTGWHTTGKPAQLIRQQLPNGVRT